MPLIKLIYIKYIIKSKNIEYFNTSIYRTNINYVLTLCSSYYGYTSHSQYDNNISSVQYWTASAFAKKAYKYLVALPNRPEELSKENMKTIVAIGGIIEDNGETSFSLLYTGLSDFYENNGYLLLDVPLD